MDPQKIFKITEYAKKRDADILGNEEIFEIEEETLTILTEDDGSMIIISEDGEEVSVDE